MRLSLIGARMGLGGADRGAADGPEALRRLDLAQLLARRMPLESVPEWTMISPMIEPGLPDAARADLFGRQLEAVCRRELSRGSLPVVLGGDRSCARWALAAAARRAASLSQTFGALWIDGSARCSASTDALPEDRALADLLSLFDPSATPALQGSRLCVLGPRSSPESETGPLRSSGAKLILNEALSSEGLARDFQEALRFLGRSDALALSFGLSALEALDLPAASPSAPGGLRLQELVSAARSSARRLRDPLCLIEISDLRPALAPDFDSAQALCEIIAAFLAH